MSRIWDLKSSVTAAMYNYWVKLGCNCTRGLWNISTKVLLSIDRETTLCGCTPWLIVCKLEHSTQFV
jgi:hypothetical protein